MHSHWRDCKAWRDEHLPLSTTSDEACKLYDATLTQYTGWYDDASVGGIEASIKGMITSDPNFAMGHVLGVGLELMGTGHSPRLDPVFKAEIDQLGTLASSTNLTQREQLHVKAIQLLGEGMMTEACDAWEKILLQHPTDMLAIKFCQDAYFYLGYQPQMRDSVARVLPSWKSSQPLYGYLMGMHAFGLCETNMYSQAEKSARKGLEMNPRDTWSTHALAHILEMEGRYNEGITFLSSTVNNWSESGGLTFHNLWHWAVYHIEKGQYQAALDIFDGELAPATKKGSMITLVDTTSLLYRLEMEGENVGERWQGLYEVCRKHQSDHLQPFYDSHMLLAYLGAEHTETATNMLESMKQLVREQPGTRYGSTHEVSISLCEALVAYDQGEFNKAVKLLYPQRYKIVTLGGSTAQRDIFNQFLIHAALKSNNTENIKLARHLLAERKALKTDAPLTDRLITQCIAIHID